MASRLTALPKESGVGQNLDDADDPMQPGEPSWTLSFAALPHSWNGRILEHH